MAPSLVASPPPESGEDEDVLLILLPLLILLCAVILLGITPFVFCLLIRCRRTIGLGDHEGPVNIAYEEHMESRSAFQTALQHWLEHVDTATRVGYERTSQWCVQHPPASPRDTDITMPQFLGIQEKGVSAWNFDPAYEFNPGAMVSGRTEIQFFADSPGMAPSEGGACTMQTNLPLPKMNEVYYWEAKMFSKPSSTAIAIGLATKPYPPFRFPGLCKHSVGYFSEDGFKCYNHPFNAESYGPAYLQGDVIGVGYRPRSGTVFFTRNGRRMEEAFVGLHNYNLFPTVAADGAAEVHVNFGQAGFVLIEANVKKWGLAPMVGTLAPPPAYGQDKGSILIETGYEPHAAPDVASTSRGPAVATDSATGEVVRIPSYAPPGLSPVGPSTQNNSMHSTHNIRMDTLDDVASPVQPAESPPPYVAATVAPRPAPARHQSPAVGSPSVWTSVRGWLARWSARRDTLSTDAAAPTELVGVTVD